MKTTMRLALIVSTFLSLAVLGRNAQAVSPAPDGGYAGGNTAEGQNTLLSLSSGTYNTAVGYFSLLSNTTNSFNTAIGAGALLANTGDQNTAIGAGSLLSNTTGTQNTAAGAFALVSNTNGVGNTANGWDALFFNTTGSGNTATGNQALLFNTTGGVNTAYGDGTLVHNVTGSNNTAIGFDAGFNATGSNNVYIGAGVEGFASDDGVCRIGSIYGATITNGTEVFANLDNRLGTITSSKRFKQNVTPTSRASEVLYKLQPVRFQYKKEIDPESRWQFGLVAEDVEKVNPDLVVRDKEGKPYSVRYDQVNAMLLNEFLKEHKKVDQLQATVAQQQKDFQAAIAKLKEAVTAQLDGQAAQIQKVCAQLEPSKSTRQAVANSQ